MGEPEENQYIWDKEAYKKIALRFLKETGLLKSFADYLRNRNFDTSEWYKTKRIDEIFGQTRFTCFLKEKKGIYPEYTITKLFRSYVNKKYPSKFEFIQDLFIEEDDYNKIDLYTDLITIGVYKKI